MEKRNEKTPWLVVGQGTSLGFYPVRQEEKELAPSLKGDMHLLASRVSFSPRVSGGWSGSYYFSIAAAE